MSIVLILSLAVASLILAAPASAMSRQPVLARRPRAPHPLDARAFGSEAGWQRR